MIEVRLFYFSPRHHHSPEKYVVLKTAVKDSFMLSQILLTALPAAVSQVIMFPMPSIATGP